MKKGKAKIPLKVLTKNKKIRLVFNSAEVIQIYKDKVLKPKDIQQAKLKQQLWDKLLCYTETKQPSFLQFFFLYCDFWKHLQQTIFDFSSQPLCENNWLP